MSFQVKFFLEQTTKLWSTILSYVPLTQVLSILTILAILSLLHHDMGVRECLLTQMLPNHEEPHLNLWRGLFLVQRSICLAEENCLQLPYLQKTEVQTLPCQARFSVICLNLLFQYCLPLDYLPTQVYPPADTKGYFLNILVFLHISVFGCIFFLFLKLKILLTSKAQVGTSFYKEFPSPHSKPN